MTVNHGKAFVAEHESEAEERRGCYGSSFASISSWLFGFALILFLSGCVHVHRFNQREFDECVKKHGGKTWKAGGIGWTCKPLPYPACQGEGFGQICRGVE